MVLRSVKIRLSRAFRLLVWAVPAFYGSDHLGSSLARNGSSNISLGGLRPVAAGEYGYKEAGIAAGSGVHLRLRFARVRES